MDTVFRRLRPASPAGALLIALLAFLTLSPGPAEAVPNTIHIVPSGVAVAPGDSVTVQLIAEPPAETLAVWAIDIGFDPDIITTGSRDCDTLDPLPDSQTISDCKPYPTPPATPDTVKVLGASVLNDTGAGLSRRAVLADITFQAIGEPGECTDLRLRVILHAEPTDGDETNPNLHDGKICIDADAPPSGTPFPHTPAPRTSEPIPDENGETAPAATEPGGSSASPGASSTGSGEPASESAGATRTAAEVPVIGESDEDSGTSVFVWVLLATGALAIVSGAAWALVRSRSGSPPGPPSA